MNLRVTESEIKNSLIKAGFSEQKADDAAADAYTNLTTAVPQVYQYELDYYLKNSEPSYSIIGLRLKRLTLLHNGNFFDALSTLAIEE